MTTATAQRRAEFRRKVEARQGLLVPGAFNALSARVIEDAGFEALYLTGAGVTNMSLGLPDLAFVGLAEMAEHTARVRDAVSLPIIVDADTGFGNALNVRHTVRVLERSGADAIQFEDQVLPKKCGHFNGKAVIGADEMVGKIRAAVDAREDGNLQIIARTDAAAVEGIEAAIERGRRFIEAGADILFIEATETLADIERLPALFDRPQLINIVIGGKTPTQSQPRLAELGYGIVLYANAALQSAVLGMQKALGTLRDVDVWTKTRRWSCRLPNVSGWSISRSTTRSTKNTAPATDVVPHHSDAAPSPSPCGVAGFSSHTKKVTK